MTDLAGGDGGVMGGPGVPHRDWIALPMVGLFSIVLIASSTEWIARRSFSESKTNLANCMVLNDSSTGPRGIPNCICDEKEPETGWVEYRLNQSGYRAGADYTEKKPGVYRIVMTGSSLAMGERVQQGESVAALLPLQLASAIGHPVELYNQAMGWGFSHNTALRFGDVLAAKPDLILWELSPMDVQRASFLLPSSYYPGSPRPDLPVNPSRSRLGKLVAFLKAPLSAKEDKVTSLLGATSTALLLRHLLYQSQSIYVKVHLTGGNDGSAYMGGEDGTGFLRIEPSAQWKNHLNEFDRDAAEIEQRAGEAHIPIAVVLVPDRIQATMISMGNWPTGYDPYKLIEEVRSIVTSHGGIFLDVSRGFRTLPNAEQYYLPVDGHLNASGNALLSKLLAKQLMSGAIPELEARAQPRFTSGHGE